MGKKCKVGFKIAHISILFVVQFRYIELLPNDMEKLCLDKKYKEQVKTSIEMRWMIQLSTIPKMS